MFNAIVILLILSNCIDGKVNVPNALLPLAPTGDSSMLVQRIIADPKLFVSELASADPQIISQVIGMLRLLLQTGTDTASKFERDVTEAKADEDAKIKLHDDLTTLVEDLTAEKILVTANFTATITSKTEEKRLASEEKKAAVNHHTAMVTERDANVPDLTTANTAISSAISLLEALLPAPTAAPTQAPTVALTQAPTEAPKASEIQFTSSPNVDVSVKGQITTTGGGWSVGTHSSETMPDSAIGFQFKVADGTSHIKFGLSHGNVNNGWSDVDYALCLRGQYSGPLSIDIYIKGAHKGNFPKYAVGDVFTQIVGAGQKIEFYRNSQLFYTSTSPATLPLLVDASFYTPSHLIDIVWIYNTSTII